MHGMGVMCVVESAKSVSFGFTGTPCALKISVTKGEKKHVVRRFFARSKPRPDHQNFVWSSKFLFAGERCLPFRFIWEGGGIGELLFLFLIFGTPELLFHFIPRA